MVIVKAPSGDATEEDQKAIEGFEEAIIEGVAGDRRSRRSYVESSTHEPSNVALFDSLAISTVDSLDLTSGKVSAVFALLGNEGNFGIKETADRPLPDLVLSAPNRAGSRTQGSGSERDGS